MPPFSPGYKYAMTPLLIQERWPNLTSDNHQFTSEQTELYNCFAWAIGLDDVWIDTYYFQDVHQLPVDHTEVGYSEYLKRYGFEICESPSIEDGFEKVAIYSDTENDFKHVARQLPSGKWTSKIGGCEDIEHNSLEDLAGKFYGRPSIFMKKPVVIPKL